MKTLIMKFTSCLIIAICFFSCTSDVDHQKQSTPKTGVTKGNNELILDFSNPFQIDSSEVVMYPLVLTNEEERDSYSSRSENPIYWNIIFFNTKNGEHHFLDEQRKMVIYAYSENNGEQESSSTKDMMGGYSLVKQFIYYSVRTIDFNHDGILDRADPNYLFISDKTGKNFRQVSPDNAHVGDWQTIKKSNKILMMVTKDNNQDGKFDDKDGRTPFVYDLNVQTPAKEVFDEKLKSKTKQLFNGQWNPKNKN